MITLPLIVFFFIGCHVTNGSMRILRKIYKPYGPLMCKELCDSSKDFYVYIQNDLTCRRNQNKSKHIDSGLNELPFTNVNNGTMKNSSKSLTAAQQLGICDNDDLSYLLQRKIIGSAFNDDQKYNRVLHQACREGKLCMVQYILSKSLADINCRGKKRMTPVMVAARSGQAAVFDFLVSQSCNFMAVNDYKNNLLQAASRGGNLYIVKKLIDSGKYDIESKGRYGFTPLFMAVDRGHREVFDFLGSKGCNLRAVSKNNGTILHLALFKNHVDIIRHIISLDVINIDSVEGHGYIPMMIAISKNNIEAVNLFVSKGCSLTAVDNDGNNILHHACLKGNMTMIKCILLVSENILSIDSRGQRGFTPLILAEQRGLRDVVKLLMSKGCSLTAVDDEGRNVLHWACYNGHVAIAEDILSQDIDLNSRGRHGKTPVIYAARKGHKKVVELLVNRNCDVKAVDLFDNNILHAACLGGHKDLVKYLLSRRFVDITAQNKRGMTPPQLARYKGNLEIVALFNK